jgi:hypothetical protein
MSIVTLLHTNIPRPTSDGQQIKVFGRQSTSIVAHQPTDDFFLRPPRSAYKTFFLGMMLAEILRTMSFTKSGQKGLKLLECERGIGGKNSPIHYIPKKDPVQEALVKTTKTNYLKLMLPNTVSKLKVALWASGTLEQFILHVHSAIHACKQMEHDVKFLYAEEAVATATLDLDIRKEEYAQTKGTKEKTYLLPPSP